MELSRALIFPLRHRSRWGGEWRVNDSEFPVANRLQVTVTVTISSLFLVDTIPTITKFITSFKSWSYKPHIQPVILHTTSQGSQASSEIGCRAILVAASLRLLSTKRGKKKKNTSNTTLPPRVTSTSLFATHRSRLLKRENSQQVGSLGLFHGRSYTSTKSRISRPPPHFATLPLNRQNTSLFLLPLPPIIPTQYPLVDAGISHINNIGTSIQLVTATGFIANVFTTTSLQYPPHHQHVRQYHYHHRSRGDEQSLQWNYFDRRRGGSVKSYSRQRNYLSSTRWNWFWFNCFHFFLSFEFRGQ